MTSACKLLVRWTTRRTKSFLMVGPMCKSVLWASLKPCRPGGKSAMVTVTVLTAGVRRALKKPMKVATTLKPMTPNALFVAHNVPDPDQALGSKGPSQGPKPQSKSSTTSRIRVSTKSQENNPNKQKAIQETTSLTVVLRS